MKHFSRKSIMYFFVLYILVTSLAVPKTVTAQDNPPNWQTGLTCEDQKYQGITYCHTTISNENKTKTKVHIMGIDLERPGIRFEYIIASGVDKSGYFGECRDVNRTQKGKYGCDDPTNANYYPLISWDEAIAKFSDTAIVVNSDYGAGNQNEPKSREHGPEGLTIVRGNRLDGKLMKDGDNNAVNRPWLAISDPPSVNGIIDQLSSDDGNKPYPWIYTGVGGAPWMIKDGKVMVDDITTCKNAGGSCYSEASQVAVGITQDKHWLFLVVGETPQPALKDKPTPLLDLAKFMKAQLGIHQAIKFDGGGSTKLWYAGNNIYVNSHRQLSQYLAVIAKPVEPGQLPPETIEPPIPIDDIDNWFKKWWNSISEKWNQWWDEQGKNLGKEFARWWEKQMQAIQKWLEQQLVQWMNETCGSVLLPVISLTCVWILYRRKHNHL